jgi:hypothetical protein
MIRELGRGNEGFVYVIFYEIYLMLGFVFNHLGGNI